MALSFSRDVLPLFRPKDISCMKPHGVLLSDPSWMCDPAGDAKYPDHANAHAVYAQLSSGGMPPDGAWPQSHIVVFQTWMAGGFSP
jgi:hypothetical protein